MRVYKFGGASVKNAEAVRNVAQIIRANNPEELLVVVSAMGKSTNALEEILHLFLKNDSAYRNKITALKEFHLAIANDLFSLKTHDIYNQLEDLFLQMEWFFELGEKDNYDFIYDQVVCFGEILSSKIVSAYLQEEGITSKWMDARNFIITNENYRDAAVDFNITASLIARKLPELLRNNVVLTQGFIGKNRNGHSTTLGREGSDFSAAIFAWALNASEVSIWKDVPGVLNADPKRFPDTVKFDKLSYHDAIEMSYYGASVLHPKTIQPLRNKQIPLHVRSFVDPQATGTTIEASAPDRKDIPTFIIKENQAIVSVATKNYSFIAEQNLSKIFTVLAENRLRMNMMQNSAISFSFCTDNDERRISHLIASLSDEYEVEVITDCQLLTIRNGHIASVGDLLKSQRVLLEQKEGNTVQFVTCPEK